MSLEAQKTHFSNETCGRRNATQEFWFALISKFFHYFSSTKTATTVKKYFTLSREVLPVSWHHFLFSFILFVLSIFLHRTRWHNEIGKQSLDCFMILMQGGSSDMSHRCQNKQDLQCNEWILNPFVSVMKDHFIQKGMNRKVSLEKLCVGTSKKFGRMSSPSAGFFPANCLRRVFDQIFADTGTLSNTHLTVSAWNK